MWGEVMTGIFTIGAITVMYIILNQVYTYNISPYGVREGTDATNAGYISTAWGIFLVPVLLAVALSIIKTGLEKRRGAYI